MNNTIIDTYKEYANKIGDRTTLYKVVVEKYNIKTAVYPGSHIDIAPSIFIPKVTYIVNFKGAIKFFKEIDTIKKYIEKNKKYEGPCEIEFVGKDYRRTLSIEKVDLIISHYAGFVGQDTKKLLKVGGILLANDSHGDASLARFDEAFELIGTINSRDEIQENHLENYFKLPKDQTADLEEVKAKMKGLKYKSRAENYLFRKVK
ncbi:hypothetical protein [Alkalibacterium kapii]|uniref:Uncharacterized protein n=1 Tax=Alkalibacterium kapii TaxID=426704 RepID=A0A511AXH3_9LACT|nr:hypothetical protein [Alkalibacterium kapii]GEK91831.1 hypothetical protein AKA01nite_14530 [Alkalibacterium kapii]